MSNITKRNTVDSLEQIIDKTIPVLDHGFIRLIDYMGSDDSIVQAARVSYGKGTKTLQSDRGLIRYLLRHKHTSPFEMCEIKLHIKVPIFIARQWLRHRTANVNEYSARYSILEQEYYIPQSDKISFQSVSNKQGRGDILQEQESLDVINSLDRVSKCAFETYQNLISMNDDTHNSDVTTTGLAKEIARIILPVNTYTQFYWKIDLHNLLHFLRLRVDGHAQYEIRAYAKEILKIVEKWVPNTYEAFKDYIVDSAHFSSQELEIIQKLLKGEDINKSDYNLSSREWDELKNRLNVDKI